MARRYRYRDGKLCYKSSDIPYVRTLDNLNDFNESACVFLCIKYILKYYNHYLSAHQKEGFRYAIHIPEDDFIKIVNEVFPEIELDNNTIKYIFKTDKKTGITKTREIQITLRLKQGIFTKQYASEKMVLFKMCDLI